ncbi:hypothetical protein [Pedobacter frigidisoli]|uniref:hypothetical protein n=1 Tax=Pedobacter frigidisoli TaxID=2530455 RepID=UPI00292D8408|nr:hypothetical protein [Pedobacter frigidisoli]
MAIANGMNRFRGLLSDFVFYTRGKKQVVRKKATSYKLSENTIKSGRDFGEATRNASYLRKAFKSLVKHYGNDDFHNRLNKNFTRVFNSIPSEMLGNKHLSQGNLKLLEGFQFNTGRKFASLCYARLGLNIDPAGFITFTWEKPKDEHFFKRVPNATRTYIQMMVFQYDLDDGGQYECIRLNDLVIEPGKPIDPKISLKLEVDLTGEKALIVAAGIYHDTKGTRSYDKRYFGCTITHALHLNEGVEVPFAEVKEEKIKDKEETGVGTWGGSLEVGTADSKPIYEKSRRPID